ncbi:hypothetical protein M0802_016210 [Mischocyttarus mexicanus]|nr:hypothetical protein M0802_016210 [Mischocyttarus mexicanus]
MNFKQILDSKLNCNIPLKTPLQIEKAVNNLTDAIQEAAWASTPQNFLPKKILTYPSIILQKIKVKRQVKATWQKHKTRSNKRLLNKSILRDTAVEEVNSNAFTFIDINLFYFELDLLCLRLAQVFGHESDSRYLCLGQKFHRESDSL